MDMDPALRERIEQKFAEMTPEDWDRVREEWHEQMSNDPGLQASLQACRRSQVSLPSYYSGNMLRFP